MNSVYRTAMTETTIDEKSEAKALMPTVAWPTLIYLAGLVLVHWGMVWLGMTGRLPLWSLVLPLGFTSYAHYTLVHESIHGNIIRARGFAWLHTVVGWYGSLMLSATWPLFERTHKYHHSFVNTDRDPDIYVKMSFPALLLRNAVSWALQVLPVLLLRQVFRNRSLTRGYINADGLMSHAERVQHHAANIALVVVMWSLVFAGFGWQVLFLYYLPVYFATNLLVILFQWLPHHPFRETGRYTATRNTGHSWLNAAFIWQNWHLMHHLWPGVPFYNYQRLYHRIRPVLEAKGARHDEGVIPRAGAIAAPVPQAAE
ncbi:fatty acid desaturase [Maricaulis sp.]|uniref:fatty acid desaturase n=1 Tax=Maricaulis sp. TaxID=1486257 RepID=UPI003A91646C